MSSNILYWFAARTMVNQELKMKELLNSLDVESYIPTHMVVKQLCDRRRMVEVAVIRGIIFVHTDMRTALSLVKERGLKARYMYDYANRSMLTVPDKQMHDFMLLINNTKADSLMVVDADFAPGDKVCVIKGDFTGIEGELVWMQGKTHVMIRIRQIIAVSVKIAKSWVAKIK